MKIEDLTLKEIKEICEKHRHGRHCTADCPIYLECDDCFMTVPCTWNSEDMEREVNNER